MSEYTKSKGRRLKLAHAMILVYKPDAKPDEELEDVVIEEMTKRVCNEFRQMHKLTRIGLCGCITEEDFHKYIMEQHDRETVEAEMMRNLVHELDSEDGHGLDALPEAHAIVLTGGLSKVTGEIKPLKRECRTFQLSESETAKANAWECEQTKKADKPATIGGRFQYRITPTSVGLVVKIYDTLLQEEIEVTEYENW